MVPRRLAGHTAFAAGATALAVALTLAGCGGGSGDDAPVPDSSEAARAAEQVRLQYRADDLIAAGAFTWSPSPGLTFVLVDAQSTIEGLVQARADLWSVTDSGVMPVGRSDMMPAAAEFGAWRFEDLTGDGLPDLFGYVADSAGVSYPVFMPGALGAMTEELASAAPGFRFATEDSIPRMIAATVGACALQLWAEEPAPDSLPAGWRFLSLLADGRLMAPRPMAPVCGATPQQEPFD